MEEKWPELCTAPAIGINVRIPRDDEAHYGFGLSAPAGTT